MSERKDNMQYIWITPLFGGLLAFIGLLTPAATLSTYIFGSSAQIWMWGLFSVRIWDIYEGHITTTRITGDPIELTISIIATLVVLIGVIGLFSSANTSRKLGFAKQKGVVPSIILIIGALIWIIGFEVYSQISTGASFWDFMGPGFGVIAPFLGAVVTLIGYAAVKTSPKRPQEPVTPIKSTIETQVNTYAPHSLKFCPSCGEKIAEANQQYCINCGHNLKNYPL